MKFPDICPSSEFPWQFFKFPDNFLTLKKYIFPDFSMTRGNPAISHFSTAWSKWSYQSSKWIVAKFSSKFYIICFENLEKQAILDHFGIHWKHSHYQQTSNISCTKSKNLNVSHLVSQSNKARCQVQNEDVVGAAPTGDAPTISERPTI